MFPADFPYLNEVSTENFQATPDKYFVPMGCDIKAALQELPIVSAFKKKDLGKVIGEVDVYKRQQRRTCL